VALASSEVQCAAASRPGPLDQRETVREYRQSSSGGASVSAIHSESSKSTITVTVTVRVTATPRRRAGRAGRARPLRQTVKSSNRFLGDAFCDDPGPLSESTMLQDDLFRLPLVHMAVANETNGSNFTF
jgi:hypothetical protein